MTAKSMSPTSDSENNARKRVGKACDRCRLKKSKVVYWPPWLLRSMLTDADSVTARARAAAAGRTTPSVSSESVRKLTIRYIQKGSLAPVRLGLPGRADLKN